MRTEDLQQGLLDLLIAHSQAAAQTEPPLDTAAIVSRLAGRGIPADRIAVNLLLSPLARRGYLHCAGLRSGTLVVTDIVAAGLARLR